MTYVFLPNSWAYEKHNIIVVRLTKSLGRILVDAATLPAQPSE